MGYRSTALLGASVVALAFGAGAARAQTAPPGAPAVAAVGEIVVTATRREATNVLKVPMAVDAYSGKSLEQIQVYDEHDLAKLDPSLDVQSFGPAEERIIIRGISSDQGATTGVYLDETPLEGGFNNDIPGDNTPTLGLHDIDHVEVLKGPQGTLFGAGSMDGTVRIITKQPNLERYGGWVDLSAAGIDGGQAQFDGSAGVNIPVVQDKLGVRVTAWGDDGGGYINQIIEGRTLKDVNTEHLAGVRGEILWKATDNLSFVATASFQHTKVDGAQDWTQYVGGIVAPFSPYVGPYSAYTNALPSQTPYFQDFQLYSVTGKYDLGFGQIIANTAYGYKNENSISDTSAQDCNYNICTDASSPPPVPAATYSAHEFFWYTSNDVRFASNFQGPFQIVAGVYYEHDHSVYDGSVANVNRQTGLAPCYTWNDCLDAGLLKNGLIIPFAEGASEIQFANSSRQTTDQVAFYTQADWKILPTLTATVGFRYFTANIEYALITQQNIAPSNFATFSFNCSQDTPQNQAYIIGCVTRPYLSAAINTTEGQPTYNLALLWQATPDVSFYVRAASGFRLGGLNEAATIAAQTGISIPNSFGPDSLWDYEAGAKAYFLDHTLYVDLTGFHIDWSNEQENATAFGIYQYSLNVGKTSINGLELDSTWRPVPELTFSGGFTYVDARLASNLPPNVVAAGTPGMTGDEMPFVPHFQATGQAEWDHHLTDVFVGYLAGDVTYHGSSNSAFEPAAKGAPSDYDFQLPAYTLLDLRAGVRWDRYDASIFARNATNTVAWGAMSANDGGLYVYSPPPLTVGVRLQATF